MPGSVGSRIPDKVKKEGRRCCGLPLWGFVLVMAVVIILVAAAVVIPVEFFVIRRQRADGEAQAALEQCRSQLTCANGGSNVLNQGFCSCICTNGFTGFDCTAAGSSGCTTMTVVGATHINNVTVGDAIPRLIQQSRSNFSVPLSGAEILAKLNAGNLSCSAMNALVTFNGQATRQAAVPVAALGAAVNGIAFTTITVMTGQFTTITLNPPPASLPSDATSSRGAVPTGGVASRVEGDTGTGFSTLITAPGTIVFATTLILSKTTPAVSPTTTSTVKTTMSVTSVAPSPTTAFAITDEVLDFARVAVLFVLQEENLAAAKTSQSMLQQFFNAADLATGNSNGVSAEAARTVTLGNGNSIDLVDFVITTNGNGKVGGTVIKAREVPNGLRFDGPGPHPL